MTEQDKLSNIMSQEHWLCRYLQFCLDTCTDFQTHLFDDDNCSAYRRSIERAIANDDDTHGVHAEFEFLYKALVARKFQVERVREGYERKPDFLIKSDVGKAFVEITYISTNPWEQLVHSIASKIKKELKSYNSGCFVDLSIPMAGLPINSEISHLASSQMEQLKQATGWTRTIDCLCSHLIPHIKNEISIQLKGSASTILSIPSFSAKLNGTDVEINGFALACNVEHLPEKVGEGTIVTMGPYSLCFSGVEYKAYGSKVKQKLGQFDCNTPNILVIRADDGTHTIDGEHSEFLNGLYSSFHRLLRVNSNNESHEQLLRLSGALLISSWSGHDYTKCAWRNSHQNAIKVDERILFDVYCAYKFAK